MYGNLCIFRHSVSVSVRSLAISTMFFVMFFELSKPRISYSIQMQKHILAYRSFLKMKATTWAPVSLFSDTVNAGECLNVGNYYQVKFSTFNSRQLFKLKRTVSSENCTEHGPPFSPSAHPQPSCKNFVTFSIILPLFFPS